MQRAELRNESQPVHIVDIWRSFELNSSLHSKKFKILLLDLLKQDEVISDETLTYFTTDKSLLHEQILTSQRHHRQFYKCKQLLNEKHPEYRFDSIHRIVPTDKAQVIGFEELRSLLLSPDSNHEIFNPEYKNFVFLNGKIDLAKTGL